jgi:hypothetical protein
LLLFVVEATLVLGELLEIVLRSFTVILYMISSLPFRRFRRSILRLPLVQLIAAVAFQKSGKLNG